MPRHPTPRTHGRARPHALWRSDWRAGRLAAVALVGASWLAACERTIAVTEPVARTPQLALGSGLGPTDAIAAAMAAAAASCASQPDLGSLRLAGGQFRQTGGAAMLGTTTSTTGVPLYDAGNPNSSAATTAVDINNAGVAVVNVAVGTTSTAYTWSEATGFVAIPAPGTFPAGTSMTATDINNLGVVVGFATVGGVARSWRYQGGTTTELAGPANLTVRAINDAGQMAGSVGSVAAPQAARNLAGSWELVGAAPSAAWAINASGTVAGYVGNGSAQRATVWPVAGAAVTLPPAPSSTSSRAFAINDAGAVVGSGSAGLGSTRAFYWSSGTGMVEILGSGFSIPAVALDIANDGRVVGYAQSTTEAGSHAFVWQAPAGPITDLGKHPTACSSFGIGINDKCEALGYSIMPAGEGQNVGIWKPCTNKPPTATIVSTAAGTCSAAATVTFSFTDPDGAAGGPYSYTVDWGDGTTTTVNNVAAPGTFTATHAYATNGTYGVKVTVTDGKGASATTSTVSVGHSCIVGSIGDFAWIDANGNGRQDAGEPGLAGVTLTLGGTASGTRTTNASGAYLFGNLPMGGYTVTVTSVPAGWVPTIVSAPGTNGANDSNASPSSTTLTPASPHDLTIDFGFVPKAGGGKGCTPGYWKQKQHFDSWKWYKTTDLVNAVFGVSYAPTMTLLDALEQNGNANAAQLFRHGTAALLNAVYQSGVSYQYTAAQVISMVRTAWLSGDRNQWNATKDLLERANEAGCPLN